MSVNAKRVKMFQSILIWTFDQTVSKSEGNWSLQFLRSMASCLYSTCNKDLDNKNTFWFQNRRAVNSSITQFYMCCFKEEFTRKKTVGNIYLNLEEGLLKGLFFMWFCVPFMSKLNVT